MTEEESRAIKSRHTLDLSYEIPISKTSTFWEGLEEGKILTTRCSDCGDLHFPPQVDCPVCLSSSHEWVELERQATLEAFTQITIAPSSFVRYSPYIVAVGELEDDVRVLAWLEDVELEDVEVGMPMELEVVQETEDRFSYRFVPSEQG